jgi:hypothetical protein
MLNSHKQPTSLEQLISSSNQIAFGTGHFSKELSDANLQQDTHFYFVRTLGLKPL